MKHFACGNRTQCRVNLNTPGARIHKGHLNDLVIALSNPLLTYEMPVSKEVGLLGHVQVDSTSSTTKLQGTSGIPRSSVHRISKQHRFRHYKIYVVRRIIIIHFFWVKITINFFYGECKYSFEDISTEIIAVTGVTWSFIL